jgi:asparagine synthase (glutamine-hydrolysing)
MCGIAGAAWSTPDAVIDRSLLDRMTDSIIHRGPDDRGIHFQPLVAPTSMVPQPLGVGLGFRRLSIIDLAGGHQPLSNEDGKVWIVFNGEIYNYRSLRQRLEGAGHRFATNTDTEVIVHLYEDLGTGCFEHLNGMFAIAIWDARTQQVVLARDRVGKKPLFYAQSGQQLCFASELKSLVHVPGLDLGLDPTAIDHYLTYQYVPHPMTIYRGVRKLKPGHFAIYRAEHFEERRFWNVDWSRSHDLTRSQTIEAIRETFIDSVRVRLRSDVPLGAFLSGGIDSSLVASVAQRELKEPLRTFAIGFPEADFDETRYAQQVADRIGSRHQRFEVTPDAVEILDKLIYHYDEPFSDSSAIPTWYLCQKTREQVTVALSGDGGDELFAGYERYKALVLSQKYQQFIPAKFISNLPFVRSQRDSGNQRSFLRRVRRFCEAIDQPAPLRYLNWLQIFGETLRSELYCDDFMQQLPANDPFGFLNQAWQSIGNRGLINQASLADLQTYLPCDLMTKVDIASMAHSLEARQPFLDYRLMELAIGTPGDWKMHRGKSKVLLREAFGDLIPAEIWTRPKMGFGVPIAKWFRNELRDKLVKTLKTNDCRLHQFMRPEAIDDLVDSHLSGKSNQGYRLWNLFVFELWLRHWKG